MNFIGMKCDRGTGLLILKIRTLAVIGRGILTAASLLVLSLVPAFPMRAHAEGTGILKGTAIFQGKPKAGIMISLYDSLDAWVAGAKPRWRAVADDKGVFQIAVAPGAYYLFGESLSDGAGTGQGFFCYFGGNPLPLPEGVMVDIPVALVERSPLPRAEAIPLKSAGRITGRVTLEGQPLEGARLYLYPSTDREFRGPDIFGTQGALIDGTGPDGSFEVDAPPGSYYLLVQKHLSGAFGGPLAEGDVYGFYDHNPLQVPEGIQLTIDLHAVSKIVTYTPSGGSAKGLTGVKGVVKDVEGNPVKSVFAYAYTDSAMSNQRPPYRSAATVQDGRYTIVLPGGGNYFFGARSGFGGPAARGQYFGTYGGNGEKGVAVAEGETLEGIDITVKIVE